MRNVNQRTFVIVVPSSTKRHNILTLKLVIFYSTDCSLFYQEHFIYQI